MVERGKYLYDPILPRLRSRPLRLHRQDLRQHRGSGPWHDETRFGDLPAMLKWISLLPLQVRVAAEVGRLLQLPLLEFASSKSVRDGNRSRKREKAREPKTQKMMRKGKGRKREGVSAKAGFEDCE